MSTPTKSPPWHDGYRGRIPLPRRIDTVERKTAKQRAVNKRCEERRMKALQMFCAGACFKRIAMALDVDPDIISYDINRLMQRYNVTSHAQLGIYVERNGLLKSDSPSATP